MYTVDVVAKAKAACEKNTDAVREACGLSDGGLLPYGKTCLGIDRVASLDPSAYDRLHDTAHDPYSVDGFTLLLAYRMKALKSTEASLGILAKAQSYMRRSPDSELRDYDFKQLCEVLGQQANFGLYGTDECRTGQALQAVECREKGRTVKVREFSRKDVERDILNGHVERPRQTVHAALGRISNLMAAETRARKDKMPPVASVRQPDGTRRTVHTADFLEYYAATVYGQRRIEDVMRETGFITTAERTAMPEIHVLGDDKLKARVESIKSMSRMAYQDLEHYGVRLLEPDTFRLDPPADRQLQAEKTMGPPAVKPPVREPVRRPAPGPSVGSRGRLLPEFDIPDTEPDDGYGLG